MPRRIIEINLLVLLATLLDSCGAPAGPTSNASATRRDGVVEACALLAGSDVAAAFGQPAEAGEAGDEPYTCDWESKENPAGTAPKRLRLTIFTNERIQAGGGKNAAAYYPYASGAAGAVYGATPELVAGVGEQATWGGATDQALPQGQLFVLHKETVFQFVVVGIGKAAAETLAKQALANY